MARVSRKSTANKREEDENEIFYNVGLYLRLSDKDNRDGNSESIENQQELLLEYVQNKQEFRVVSVFIDDGKTGTNFQRNGFEQMMEAAKTGVINCIIVKDLSRFARNYLEAGNYIENIFPFLNIRFIAVTDGFDTLTATSSQLAYLIPLKNMMNENYARDISKKERSAKKILRKKGYYLGAYAIYGYTRSKENRHMLVIDQDAAVHVREIYSMCEAGYSDSAIAKYLNKNQVVCPARYKYEKGLLHNEKYANTAGWYAQTVAMILTSRTYVGDMVQGKRECKGMKGKMVGVSEKNWDIVSGTHQPIILQEQFEKVQQIRRMRHEKYKSIVKNSGDKTESEGILKGKIFCGDCGKAMTRKHIKSCKDKYRYVCEIYDKNGNCTQKYLRELELLTALKSIILSRVEISCDIKKWMMSEKQNNRQELDRGDQKSKDLEINRLLKMKASLYTDWKTGILDEVEYCAMKNQYENKIERYRLDVENPALKVSAKLSEDFVLTKELADAFIERIDVFKYNRIKINLRFQDEFNTVLTYWENCKGVKEMPSKTLHEIR